MNDRRLDALLPKLEPPLSPDEEEAVRAVARVMEERELFITSSDRTGGVFHLTFGDAVVQLGYSVLEMVELAEELEKGAPFPWDDELKRQGNR